MWCVSASISFASKRIFAWFLLLHNTHTHTQKRKEMEINERRKFYYLEQSFKQQQQQVAAAKNAYL